MTGRPRRAEDRVTHPSYVEGLESLPTDEVRKRKVEAEQIEAELSYVRRLLQGKLDILRHEIERRAAGGETELHELVDRLPEILAEGNAGSGGRLPRILLPRQIERRRREVDEIASDARLARIDEQSTDELRTITEELSAAERETSSKRRRIQEVVDALSAELVRRYREGTEDPTALLTS